MTDKDPYTSDQQRERDEYEINDTDWNEVVFEEVNGSFTAKLALHNDWINQKRYQVDTVVNLDLLEQGISDSFIITSIRHIIPQKKPVDDDEGDDYDYRPVIGLFIHTSFEAWKIKFDNGEELGVTHNHPVYSTTLGDWQFAGMLQIGEEVLTKQGGTEVLSKQLDKAQEVYNLEVKGLHNFLVGESGIIVHNNYFPDAKQLAKVLGIPKSKIHDVKKLMIKDWKNDFPSGFGNNPDIGYSDSGKLLFKSRVNNEIFNTGFDIINYID